MRSVFYYFQGSREEWSELASQLLEKKISSFMPFEIVALKSKSQSRDKSQEKIQQEEKRLFEVVDKSDFLVIFDEAGKIHRDSIEFSKTLVRALESGRHRLVFFIGGPYGFSDEVKKRADLKLSLSPLTMNHHVAKIAGLEQIYRGLTIWKNIKYHNA